MWLKNYNRFVLSISGNRKVSFIMFIKFHLPEPLLTHIFMLSPKIVDGMYNMKLSNKQLMLYLIFSLYNFC